jgi:hypothetical protein
MSKFDILTKYIPMIQSDIIGEWVIDKENGRTPALCSSRLVLRSYNKSIWKIYKH